MSRSRLAVGFAALATYVWPRLASVSAGAAVAALLLMGYVLAPYHGGAKHYPRTRPDPALRAVVEAAADGGRLFAPSVVLRGENFFSRLRVVSGYESSLRPARVGRLLDDAGLVEHFVGLGPDWAAIVAHRPLLDLLSVALLVPDGYVPLEGFLTGPFLPGGRLAWRNPTALPRAFVVHRARAAASPEEAHAAVTDPRFRPGEEAVVEGPVPPLAAPSTAERARLVVDEPGRVVVEAAPSAPGLLVLSDSFFPGWEAAVDGIPVPILLTDYAFRGVPLAPGSHRVVFHYRPRSFWTGAWLAAGAAAVALGAPLRRRGRA